MELREYQQQAQSTDQVPIREGDGLVVPLLGMAGEVGSLLVEYKKRLRDGPAHRLFRDQFAEELGDIFWYLANLASKFDLDLDWIAQQNLQKTRDRWRPRDGSALESPATASLLDEDYPPTEQLPRSFVAEITEEVMPEGKARITLTVDGEPVGSELTDNAYQDDGYRFHDVFHLAHAAVLGWSPVVRKILARKRKSKPEIDEVEDGGRAIVIDEAIVAFVFDYARKHNFLEGVETVDYQLLKTIRSLTSGLEVRARSAHEWEESIVAGYRVWRAVRVQRGGTIVVDLSNRTLELR